MNVAACGCVAQKKKAGFDVTPCAMHASAPNLLDACKLVLSRLQINGEWDDGCFYYNGKSASELQDPIARLQQAIALAEGKLK